MIRFLIATALLLAVTWIVYTTPAIGTGFGLTVLMGCIVIGLLWLSE